jgi:hypothetical protein
VPTFYQRPLTWLFWIAALCLDAVALSIDYEGRFASALGLGQLLVVSGWLVLGKSHLLARAAWFVIAIALLVAPDYAISRWRSPLHQDVVWPHVLALMIAAGAFAALATGGWAALLAAVSPEGQQEHRKPQYSIAALLGWMIVLAVISTGLRVADFSLLGEEAKDLVTGGGLAAAAAIFIAAGLGSYQESWGARILSAIGFAACIGVMAAVGLPPDAAAVAVGALAFVVVWTMVVRLDGRERSTAAIEQPGPSAAIEPQLRVFIHDA